MNDVDVVDQGSVVLFTPITAEARDFVDDNVGLEDWQWLGGSFAVDARYAGALIEGFESHGFTVSNPFQ